MKPANQCVLTLNGGSSSIKFALHENRETLKRGLHGAVDRSGMSGTALTFVDQTTHQPYNLPPDAAGHTSAATSLPDWLAGRRGFESLQAAGHRVVHGIRCYDAKGVRRHGFHGLSYAYLMEELGLACASFERTKI